MPIDVWTDDCDNTFSKPYIPQKIVGFSGIDPDLVSETGGGSSGEPAQDHEKLQRVLGGGGEGDHYHLDHNEHLHLTQIHNELFPTDGRTQAVINFIGQVLRESTLNELIDARIREYLSNNP
ncbi:MAG: hypothetical protein IJU48_07025 [Synergistaceae bacterium]|nr:hypothetical protein [Synergistaceae bacterium]